LLMKFVIFFLMATNYIYIFQISKFAKTNLACFGIIVYGHFHSDKLGCNVDVVFRKTKKKQLS